MAKVPKYNAVQRAVLANRNSLIMRERSLDAEVERLLKPLAAEWERAIRGTLHRRTRDLTPTQIAEALRRTGVMVQLRAVSDQYAKSVERAVGQVVRETFRSEAYRASHAASLGPEPVRLGVGFGGLNRGAVAAAARSPILTAKVARDLSGFSAATVTGLRRDLTRAVADGWNLSDLVEKWSSGAGAGRAISQVRSIARTAMMAASNQGQVFQWRQEGLYQQLRWEATFDARTCPACGARHGKVYDINNLPPLPAHYGCVLPDTEVSPGTVIAASRAVYRGDVVAIRTGSGRVLTVTPNHPVMTTRGFVPAGLLREGDNLVRGPVAEGILSGLLGPDNQDRPSTAQQVFESLVMASPVGSARVPTSAEDFHGDAVGFNGEIDVIRAHGLVWNGHDSSCPEYRLEPDLIAAATSGVVPLSCQRRLDERLRVLRLAADRVVGGGRQSEPFFAAGLAHAQVHRLAPVSLDDAELREMTNDHVPGYPELRGDRLDRAALVVELADSIAVEGYPIPARAPFGPDLDPAFLEPFEDDLAAAPQLGPDGVGRVPGGVQTDRVVNIEREPYSGHIFDLQTVSETYVANGIVVHNCRCVWLPVFATDSERALRSLSPYKGAGPGAAAGRARSYEAWLGKQPAGVQMDILGSELKYQVWRDGDLTLAQLTNPDATTLTDAQVRRALGQLPP